MKRRFVAVFALAGIACHEPTVSGPIATAPGFLRLSGGISFEASGTPTISDKTVVPATFAVALVDSVAGPYILAFNARGSGVGDFFVLRLNAVRSGTFGPCADGPSTRYPDGSVYTPAGACQGRLLKDVRAGEMVFSSTDFLESVSGTVTVQSAGERLVGTVANLKLVGARGDETATTISSGEFDLPLLRGDAARVMESCFLWTALERKCTP